MGALWASEFRRSRLEASAICADKPSVRAEFQAFLEQLEFTKGRSARTGVIYAQILADFDVFLAGAELSEESARSYLRTRALAVEPSTQALTVSVLRSLSRWLKTEGRGRAWLLKTPRQTQKKIRVFAEEDLGLLMQTIEQRPLEEQILFHLLYGSALRISEALSLSWPNLDLKKFRARVLGKGAKWREVPITHHTAELFAKVDKGGWHLCPSEVGKLSAGEARNSSWHGGSISYPIARKWVAAWGEDSGVAKKYGALHPHLLRHALASHLLRRGVRLPHIQKLLGHSRLSTTEKYTHLEVDDLLRAYDLALPKKLVA